jgi:hypothetical protein
VVVRRERVRVTTQRRMRWVGHADCVGEQDKFTQCFSRKTKAKDKLEDLDVDGGISKRILKGQDG